MESLSENSGVGTRNPVDESRDITTEGSEHDGHSDDLMLDTHSDAVVLKGTGSGKDFPGFSEITDNRKDGKGDISLSPLAGPSAKDEFGLGDFGTGSMVFGQSPSSSVLITTDVKADHMTTTAPIWSEPGDRSSSEVDPLEDRSDAKSEGSTVAVIHARLDLLEQDVTDLKAFVHNSVDEDSRSEDSASTSNSGVDEQYNEIDRIKDEIKKLVEDLEKITTSRNSQYVSQNANRVPGIKKMLNGLAKQLLRLEVDSVYGSVGSDNILDQLSSADQRVNRVLSDGYSKINNRRVFSALEILADNLQFHPSSNFVKRRLVPRDFVAPLEQLQFLTDAFWVLEAKDTSTPVIRVMLLMLEEELPKVKEDTRGLIGSENKSLQQLGQVLLVVTNALLIVIGTAAIASALGFTIPAGLLSYVATTYAAMLVTKAVSLITASVGVEATMINAALVSTAACALFGATAKRFASTQLKKDINNVVDEMMPLVKAPTMS